MLVSPNVRFVMHMSIVLLLWPTCQYAVAKLTATASPLEKFFPQLFVLFGFATYFFFTLSKWANEDPKPPSNSVDQIFELFNKCGDKDYIGENVSQLQHMLQAAGIALQKIQEHPEFFYNVNISMQDKVAAELKNSNKAEANGNSEPEEDQADDDTEANTEAEQNDGQSKINKEKSESDNEEDEKTDKEKEQCDTEENNETEEENIETKSKED